MEESTQVLSRKKYNEQMAAANRKIHRLTKTVDRLKADLETALARHKIATGYQTIVEKQCKHRC